MQFIRNAGALLGAALLLCLTAYGQQYNANDVTPPNTGSGKLAGASSAKQAGGGGAPYTHALLLSGNALAATDLHPAAGYYNSMATSMDDAQECGYGGANLGGIHALLWTGASNAAIDLQPSGYGFSYCMGVYNGQQVGFAENQVYFLTTSHAMLWTGSAGSAVDLHPAGVYPYSRAMGVRNGEEVGYASQIAYPYGESTAYHTTSHAYRWTGSAASAVDLNPAAFTASEALATNGTQQGGWGYDATAASPLHALLWSGTPDSVVDLHPAGYTDTKVTGLSDTQQVGEGWVGPAGAAGSVRHALLWTGTADSVVDLNQFLPPGYTHAVATGIQPNGDVVGYAYNTYAYGMNLPPDAIAVIFNKGAMPSSAVSALTLNPANAAPNSTVQGTVTLAGAAPAAGVALTFLSTNPTLVATPASITIPEGQSTATFTANVAGTALQTPSSLKIYVTDGTYSRTAALAVTPVVKLSTVSVNAVEGGFTTYGAITLSIPAQAGGAAIALSSGDTSLATVPASITVPAGYTSYSFSVSTTPVAANTTVPLTASFNGTTVNASLTLSAAPVVSVSALTFPDVVGGQAVTGTVTLNNFPRGAGGATIALTSGDPSVQVPATVTVPQGAYSASFTAGTSVVSNLKSVTVQASYNGSVINGTVAVNPIPKVTIISAEYFTDTKLFKVQANTTFANSILTYGADAASGPIGTMQIELGIYKGSTIMATAPRVATVWNSNGGSATMNVTVKTAATGGGGGGASTGGGGGGGGTTASGTFKLSVSRTGKGSVASSPNGIACGTSSGTCTASFTSGTPITLTATPDPGGVWVGWSGGCTGSSLSCTLTLSKDTSVTANFK